MKDTKNFKQDAVMLEKQIIGENVVEGERTIPIAGEYNVIITGGGGTGLMAAIASARNGASTLLLEQDGFLGGSLTAGYQLNFGQPSFVSKSKQLIRGIPGEMVERMVVMGGFLRSNGSSPFDPEIFKYAGLKMLLQAGVNCRFYTAVTDSIVENNTIKGVITESKAGRQAFLAERIVDCTGDGDVAARSGVPYFLGRDSDHHVQPINMGFIVGGVELNAVIKHVKNNPEDFGMGLNRTILETGGKPVVRVTGFFEATRKYATDYGMQVLYTRFGNLPTGSGEEICYVNMARAYKYNPLDPEELTKAEIMLREQVFPILKFLKHHIPGFKNAYLLSTSPSLGVRESRQIMGEYVLQAQDVTEGRMFEDAILHSAIAFGKGGHPHPVDGWEGAPGSTYEYPSKEWKEYEIPYGVSVPRKIDNLLVAGKCKSATHQAMALTKSVPVCMAEGQSAGTAAALSIKERITPRDLDVEMLQQQLRKDGAYLPER